MHIRIILISCILASASVGASTISEQELSTAKAVVADYKELRKFCSGTVGDERKECFRHLNEANEAYQQAKGVLASLKSQDVTNLHLVSQAY
ncbi:hypothetical protein [Teredinibacter haidensis]|uniref:hypothetical protein n=1 Tax=Teredinibacter haidensis TaxID=2731755 RepID=UPI0011152235|nr:hypothetical protein [Teredinibacter haidensis]